MTRTGSGRAGRGTDRCGDSGMLRGTLSLWRGFGHAAVFLMSLLLEIRR